MKRKAAIVALTTLIILALLAGITAAAQPVVRALFFYSPNCPHCHLVIDEFLPLLFDKYGDQLEIAFIDISSPTNYQGLLMLEAAYGIDSSQAGVPEMFIGDYVLMGSIEIPEKLEGIVQEYLAKGGVDYPALARLAPAETPAGTPAVTPTPAPAVKPMYLAYFYKAGCQECSRVEYDLRLLEAQYPGLTIARFDVVEDARLNEWLSQRAGVPMNKRLVAPAVFVGDDYLIDDQISFNALSQLMQKYQATGVAAVWEGWDSDLSQAEQGILQRFRSFGALTVAAAGLIDGLNPCAFATIIFFVSYLTLSGKKGKQIIITGASFTLGVFIAYLLVGLGFYKVLDLISGFTSIISKIVYILTAVLCLVLAVLSIRDFIKVRKGDLSDMALKLPEPLRMRINQTVREGRKASSHIVSAFVTGLLISLLELACTGQIYLPVIISMSSVPAMRGQALLYLLLYNLMFIMPLIVVFVLAYYGTTSKQFTEFLRKHAGAVKIGMAIVFLSLATWLIFSLLK
jgi:cytochrome c biogenesis protein CcdA